MSEGIPKSIERGPEKILTKAEALEGVEMFVKGAEIKRELSDEQGLYLLEVVAEGEVAGETIEYGYLRKGQSPGHKNALETAIHCTYYDADGIPISGGKVAVFENGKWVEKGN